MHKAFKYKLYPTRQQEVAMLTMLDTHRHLYNRALAERKEAWEQERHWRNGAPACYCTLNRAALRLITFPAQQL